MTDLRIRRATAADAAALAALAERTFRDTFAAVNTPKDMAVHAAAAYGVEKQLAEIESAHVRTLIVDAEGSAAAYAQLRHGRRPDCVSTDDAAELWRFYIDRGWIGQGLAQRLMEAVFAEASAMGARGLWLGVWEHNPRAIAFYRKCGFVEVSAHVFQLGADAQTDLIMQRKLAS